MTGAPAPDRTARIAVLSRKVVFVVGLALIALGVLALLNDQLVLGIVLVVVAGVIVFARGMWTLRRGLRSVAERERADVPEAPVVAPGAASAVDRVVADLVGMNSDGLPYLIDARRTDDGVRVEVRWKVEEVRWQTLFVAGKVAHHWRMEIDLDPARTTYKFIEYSGKADARAAIGPGGVAADASWTWHRGKTSGQRNLTIVEGADGQVTVAGAGGPRTSWEGVASIRPSDAKVPVFTVLRNHGWRPRFDWFGARMVEK
ncbi:hypothetical protein UQW22_01155 [Isoptericola halotolerans]|uniref:hypothetical protein n=1 Tax=Isoptericola halotolerans TaxID=300560 RepID=UPI003890A96C